MNLEGHRVRSRLTVALLAAFAIGTSATAATIGISGTVLTATADGSDDILFGAVSGLDLEFIGISFTALTPGCAARSAGQGGDDILIGTAGGTNCLDGGAGDNVTVNNGGLASNCGALEPVFPPVQPVQVPDPHS